MQAPEDRSWHDAVHAERSWMLRIARDLAPDSHEADDLVQETWLRLLRHRPARIRSTRAFVGTTLRRLVATRREERASRRRRETASEPVRASLSPREESALEDLRDRLREALLRLPPEQRRALSLRYLEQLDVPEIARRENTPVATIKTRLKRGLARMRTLLDPDPERGLTRGAFAPLVAAPGALRGRFLETIGVSLMSKSTVGVLAATTVLVGILSIPLWGGDDASVLDAGDYDATLSVAETARRTESPAEKTRPAPEEQITAAPEAEDGDSPDETPLAPAPEEPLEEVPSIRVRFRVVDAISRADLEGVEIRAVSHDRLVETRRRSPLAIELPAQDLDLVTARTGYESKRIRVALGDDHDEVRLETIALERGRSRIHGRIINRDPHRRVATIHLHGRGISPDTIRLAQAGTADGTVPHPNGGSAETRPLDGQFRFEALASGAYLITGHDEKGFVLATARVTLEANADRDVELGVSFRDLTVRIEGRNQAPFDGAWTENGVWYGAPIRLFFWADGVHSSRAEIAASLEGLSGVEQVNDVTAPSIDPSRRADAAGSDGEHEPGRRREEAAASYPPRPETTLRRRRASDGVWPVFPSPAPLLPAHPLSMRRVAPGLYEVRGVPAATTKALAVCGPLFTFSTPMDPQARSADPVLLVLSRQCNASTAMLEDMSRNSGRKITCTSCHQLPRDIFR